MKKKRKTVAPPGGQIVKAIQKAMREQDRTKYWLAKQCGIDPRTIYSKFDRDFGVRHADRMLKALDLEIVPRSQKAR